MVINAIPDHLHEHFLLFLNANQVKKLLQVKPCDRGPNPNIRVKRCLPCDQQRPRIGDARGLDTVDLFCKIVAELFDPGAHGDFL